MLKVERPDGGDFARAYDNSAHGTSAHFAWLNRGKRSVALDLRSPEGLGILADLISHADVLISNLSPSATDRLFDDRALALRHPQLIRCYISGYGPDGPHRERKAFDLLIQGEAGVTLATGTPDKPAKAGVSVADLSAGTQAFGAILAALVARARDGQGRRIDISLFDATTEWMMPLLLACQLSGAEPAPRGLHHASIAPYGAYRTKDGTLVNIAVQNEQQWVTLCEALELHDLAAAPQLRTASVRFAERSSIDRAVAESVAGQESAPLCSRLERAGVPFGLVRAAADVLAHPQLADPRRWSAVAFPDGSTERVLTGPMRINGSFIGAGEVPGLGQHTRETLSEIGVNDATVMDLASRSVIGLPLRADTRHERADVSIYRSIGDPRL